MEPWQPGEIGGLGPGFSGVDGGMSLQIPDAIIASAGTLDGGEEGPIYRCSARLVDGLLLPCVVVKQAKPQIKMAIRQFKAVKKGLWTGEGDAYRQVVGHFTTQNSQISEHNVVEVVPSPYAMPLSLLKETRGETQPGWSAWVFEMRDGTLFNYATAFERIFMSTPEGYGFDDVVRVHPHSFVRKDGELALVRRHEDAYLRLVEFGRIDVYGPLVSFDCFLHAA